MSNTNSQGVDQGLFSILIKPLDLTKDFQSQQDHIHQLLYRYLNTRTVVALVGSGCSMELGYPSWGGFAKQVLKARPSTQAGSEAYERFRRYLQTNRLPEYVTYRTIFGECERHYEGSTFRDNIQKYFFGLHNQARDKRRQSESCYKALLDLEIRRFVTTNYDLEIEMALMNERKVSGEELFGNGNDPKTLEKLGPKPLKSPLSCNKSFVQRSDCREQLSRFSLARNEASEYMVFHCHGRIDDMASCVITEEDYRHWYLRDDDEVKARQQTMDVLLSSNPLLLVGYGMGDPELMHMLQFVHANRLNDPNRSPLFVLLLIPAQKRKGNQQTKQEDYLLDICASLHSRYGAYVLPVLEDEKTPAQKLKELKGGWLDWWKLIQAKPLVKTFFPPTDRSYFHYRIEQLNEKSFIHTKGYEKLEHALVNLIENQKDGERFALVSGPAGTGKTWSTQWFAIRCSEAKVCSSDGVEGHRCKIDRKIFFWSSYYTNDLFTGIKRALKFFGQATVTDPVYPENMLEKFEKLLNEQPALLIFDGIERLLQPVDNVADGKAVNQDVARFFKLIRNSKRAFVLLTSRQWPIDLLSTGNPEDEKLKKRLQLRAPKCLTEDLAGRDGSVYQRINSTHRTSLCALLEGHLYCLSLIEKMLHDEHKHLDDRVEALLRSIVSTPADRRAERVIRVAIDSAEDAFKKARQTIPDQPTTAGKDPFNGNLLLKFLERVALFMNPIEPEVLRVCLTLAVKEISEGTMADGTVTFSDEPDLESVVSCLLTRSLLVEVKFNDSTQSGYTVHPLLQRYVRKHLHHSVFSSHPSMILPGYTSAFEVVDPGSQSVGLKVSRELLEELCSKAEQAAAEDKVVAGMYSRSAFGVLRSRFCANTVSRWGNYQDYAQMVYRLYDTARLSSAGVWYHAEYETKGDTLNDEPEHKTRPPLYMDELAWLFNELGFSAFSFGNMLDAMVIWQQGLEVNGLVDGTTNGVYRFQSYFNLGVGFIHLGNLHHARIYLDRAIQIAYEMQDHMLRGRVLGYIALLKYLQGNLDDADHDFEEACEQLKGNARGLSVFLTHHGEMLLRKGELDRARQKINNSRSLAEGAYFPDLVAYARLAQANLLRHEEEYTKAQNEYSAAFDAAKRIGLRRLETAVLSGMSRWAYDLNDSEIARQKAFAALKVANETSLGLHQTLALLTLGKALVLANQRDLGRAYLRSARLVAKEQGYFLRETEAEGELRQLGEPIN